MTGVSMRAARIKPSGDFAAAQISTRLPAWLSSVASTCADGKTPLLTNSAALSMTLQGHKAPVMPVSRTLVESHPRNWLFRAFFGKHAAYRSWTLTAHRKPQDDASMTPLSFM